MCFDGNQVTFACLTTLDRYAYCLPLLSLAVFSPNSLTLIRSDCRKVVNMSGGKETLGKLLATLQHDWDQEVGACVVLFS